MSDGSQEPSDGHPTRFSSKWCGADLSLRFRVDLPHPRRQGRHPVFQESRAASGRLLRGCGNLILGRPWHHISKLWPFSRRVSNDNTGIVALLLKPEQKRRGVEEAHTLLCLPTQYHSRRSHSGSTRRHQAPVVHLPTTARVAIMSLSMILALTICPAMLGIQESIRQNQSKARREQQRARRCNLVVSCVKPSLRSRDIDKRMVVLRGGKVRLPGDDPVGSRPRLMEDYPALYRYGSPRRRGPGRRADRRPISRHELLPALPRRGLRRVSHDDTARSARFKLDICR